MPASKDSKFRARIARQRREAQRTSFARERTNDAPRNPKLDPHYSTYYGVPGSSVDADDLAARLKAREHKALGKDDD